MKGWDGEEASEQPTDVTGQNSKVSTPPALIPSDLLSRILLASELHMSCLGFHGDISWLLFETLSLQRNCEL